LRELEKGECEGRSGCEMSFSFKGNVWYVFKELEGTTNTLTWR